LVKAPDLFFTYMSHRYPRLLTNAANASFVNSMHGLRLGPDVPKWLKAALPLLVLSSVSMLGAEVYGRSYGGGVLKMEPREAASLPVPKMDVLECAWKTLKESKPRLDRELRDGRWTGVVAFIDDVLLRETLGLDGDEVTQLHEGARSLRERRLGREGVLASGGSDTGSRRD
jgi:hypothetical protein